jgi:hypothetical protein
LSESEFKDRDILVDSGTDEAPALGHLGRQIEIVLPLGVCLSYGGGVEVIKKEGEGVYGRVKQIDIDIVQAQGGRGEGCGGRRAGWCRGYLGGGFDGG